MVYHQIDLTNIGFQAVDDGIAQRELLEKNDRIRRFRRDRLEWALQNMFASGEIFQNHVLNLKDKLYLVYLVGSMMELGKDDGLVSELTRRIQRANYEWNEDIYGKDASMSTRISFWTYRGCNIVKWLQKVVEEPEQAWKELSAEDFFKAATVAMDFHELDEVGNERRTEQNGCSGHLLESVVEKVKALHHYFSALQFVKNDVDIRGLIGQAIADLHNHIEEESGLGTDFYRHPECIGYAVSSNTEQIVSRVCSELIRQGHWPTMAKVFEGWVESG